MMIKETLLYLLESKDQEILEAFDEILSDRAKAIVESMSPAPSLDNSKPKDGDLFDRLVEVASGDKPEVVHSGKKVKAPAKGVGFQSSEKIKEWATKAYTKLGGEWIPKGEKPQYYSGFGSMQETNSVIKTISVVREATPDQLFGSEAASGWANLAFPDDKK